MTTPCQHMTPLRLRTCEGWHGCSWLKTVLHKLQLVEAVSTIPTIGINVETVSTRMCALPFGTSDSRTRSVLSGASSWRCDSINPATSHRMRGGHQRSVDSVDRFGTWQHNDTPHVKLSARHLERSTHEQTQRTDTVNGKTMAKPSVTDERSHDSKLFVTMKVPGVFIGHLEESGCPQEISRNCDMMMSITSCHSAEDNADTTSAASPCAVKNMTKQYTLLFAAHHGGTRCESGCVSHHPSDCDDVIKKPIEHAARRR